MIGFLGRHAGILLAAFVAVARADIEEIRRAAGAAPAKAAELAALTFATVFEVVAAEVVEGDAGCAGEVRAEETVTARHEWES